MSATKKKRPAVAIDPKDLKRVRNGFNQILWSNAEHKRLSAMSNFELAKESREFEIQAADARYALWRRRELEHQGN